MHEPIMYSCMKMLAGMKNAIHAGDLNAAWGIYKDWCGTYRQSVGDMPNDGYVPVFLENLMVRRARAWKVLVLENIFKLPSTPERPNPRLVGGWDPKTLAA